MVEPHPKHYTVISDKLARIDIEIPEKIPDEKIFFIDREHLLSKCNFESQLFCMFCKGLVNQPVACKECHTMFCWRCITEYLKSDLACPASRCKK